MLPDVSRYVPSSAFSPVTGVLLLHQSQLCGTASPNNSETQHYPLIRLVAILIHTFFARYTHDVFLSALETLTACAIQVFYCDCDASAKAADQIRSDNRLIQVDKPATIAIDRRR